ncbi:MAG: glutamyl-tRNA synthetase [Candidatus Woesearchaeota archaeon]|nr:glutamyl-tRNA synthetase [Candidatus Woesearchaeota archaeon]
MKPELLDIIEKHALKNAIEHDGKANPKALIGKVISEFPEYKQKIKELLPIIEEKVSEINNLSLEEQKDLANKKYPEIFKKEKKEKDLPELPNAIRGKVVTRIPPEPSKYAHIGHALSFLINYLYAKRYEGKSILRFEDTNPEKSKQEFVDSMLEDIQNYLGIIPDKIIFASDDMQKFIDFATDLVKRGEAYVCFCNQEIMRENRQKGIECACRNKSVDQNLKEWQDMIGGKYKEGECTLRLKIDMKHKNYVMRDPVIFRIVEHPHYKYGSKYKVWPMYDFENSLEDAWNGVTHILRSNEFGKMREELQNYIKGLFDYPKPFVKQYGRFNVIGATTKGREIRELIEKGELIGWDDPRLVTLKALRRRGIQREALYEMVKKIGLSSQITNIDWNFISAFNRKIVDKSAKRFMLIKEPVKIQIKNAPEEELKIRLHPDVDYGYKTLRINGEFYIEKEDFDKIKDNEVVRLMECLNFYKKGNEFYFHSKEYEDFKGKGSRIIHWLPADDKQLLEIKVMMPDAKKIKALVEYNISMVKVDEIVQFERFGFARKDSQLEFWYSHK